MIPKHLQEQYDLLGTMDQNLMDLLVFSEGDFFLIPDAVWTDASWSTDAPAPDHRLYIAHVCYRLRDSEAGGAVAQVLKFINFYSYWTGNHPHVLRFVWDWEPETIGLCNIEQACQFCKKVPPKGIVAAYRLLTWR